MPLHQVLQDGHPLDLIPEPLYTAVLVTPLQHLDKLSILPLDSSEKPASHFVIYSGVDSRREWESVFIICVSPCLSVMSHFFVRIFREDSKHLDVPPYKEGGGLLTTVKRLDGEFVKVLKRGDEHSSVERLRDKTKGMAILEKDNLVQRIKGREDREDRGSSTRIEHEHEHKDLEYEQVKS